MIGPSSSHTAGAVRLGALARAVFGGMPSNARIGLHGSFATTGSGHGTDIALVAGLLGMKPDDGRIPDSLKIAEECGLQVQFDTVDLGQAHPNTARFQLDAPDRPSMSIVGSSLGGGAVVVTQIDGFEVEISGELPMLVVEHLDRPGAIAAVTAVIAQGSVNIASMNVSREQRGARALMLIATDVPVSDEVAERISGEPSVTSVRRVEAV